MVETLSYLSLSTTPPLSPGHHGTGNTFVDYVSAARSLVGFDSIVSQTFDALENDPTPAARVAA